MRLKVKVRGSDGENILYPEVAVVDAETGEPLKWVRRISFDVEPGDIPVLKLEVLGFDLDIEADAETAMIPAAGLGEGLVDVSPLGRQDRVKWKVGNPEPGIH